jgi:hypothetical protein
MVLVVLIRAGRFLPRKVAQHDRMGIRIAMDTDRPPYCNTSTGVLCDAGGFNGYGVEGEYCLIIFFILNLRGWKKMIWGFQQNTDLEIFHSG